VQVLGLFALVLAVICTAVLFAKGHPAMMIVWRVVFVVFALPLIVRGWVSAWSFFSGHAKPQRHARALRDALERGQAGGLPGLRLRD